MTIAGTHTCARCAALEQHTEQLQAQVAQLQAELAAAKKNSANSSKPPSSDIVKKPKTKAKNGSKKKRGAQPGHDKHERTPFAIEQIDECIEYHFVECPDCHGPVVPSKLPPKVIQQVDLLEPPELIRVVEFRSQACWCRKCKQVHYAPIDAAKRRAGLVGSRLTTLIAYLKGGCHCSYSTIRKFIRDVLCIKISRGYLAKLISKASASLKDVYDALADRLPYEPYVNVDETGHKNYKQSMWAWCFRASLFTLFKIDKSRGSDVLIEMLGKEFKGVLGCDYFSAYRKYMKDFGVLVQFCLAHLLRDVRFLVEHPNEENQVYGRRLLKHLRAMFAVIHDRDQYTPQDFQTELQQAGNRVRTAAMWSVPDTKEAENLSKRFRKHGESYLRFITTPGIEPTNNLAEQAIRFVVIDRKVTQGSRSETGQRWLERIWTVMATCAQSGRSVFEFLHESLTAYFADEPAPKLLPDST